MRNIHQLLAYCDLRVENTDAYVYLARYNEMSSFDDISLYDLLATDRDILLRQHGIRAYFQGDLCWRRR